MKSEMAPCPGPDISDWLKWGKTELAFLGEHEAHQECERMLEALFGVSRAELYLSTQPQLRLFPRFSEWIEVRKGHVPLAYLARSADFWEDRFEVQSGVFIPRPETEGLIEAFLNEIQFTKEDAFRFLDLGSGSGVIATTLAKLFPRSRAVAADLSDRALAVTRRNARRLGVEDRVVLVQGDGVAAFGKATFDTILSNPPYVASGDWGRLDPEVREEPRVALDGGEDGLDFYRKIFQDLSCLKSGGSLWVEVGWGLASGVQSLFERKGFKGLRVFKDLNGIDRVIAGIHSL